MFSSATSPFENDPAAWRGQNMMKCKDWHVSITDSHRKEIFATIEYAKNLRKKKHSPLPKMISLCQRLAIH